MSSIPKTRRQILCLLRWGGTASLKLWKPSAWPSSSTLSPDSSTSTGLSRFSAGSWVNLLYHSLFTWGEKVKSGNYESIVSLDEGEVVTRSLSVTNLLWLNTNYNVMSLTMLSNVDLIRSIVALLFLITEWVTVCVNIKNAKGLAKETRIRQGQEKRIRMQWCSFHSDVTFSHK